MGIQLFSFGTHGRNRKPYGFIAQVQDCKRSRGNGGTVQKNIPYKLKKTHKMKVTDLNGCPIEVTDLKEAISITAQYKTYRHIDSSFAEFDKRQNAYWADMHEKLMAIKKRLDDN
jgi:hypothetical protein